jgi:hypothetical protein
MMYGELLGTNETKVAPKDIKPTPCVFFWSLQI